MRKSSPTLWLALFDLHDDARYANHAKPPPGDELRRLLARGFCKTAPSC